MSHAHIITTQFTLKGIKVGTLESMKTLGVKLDKLLIFKGHISGQLKKAYSKHPHIRTHDFGGQADCVLIYQVLNDKSASKCS